MPESTDGQTPAPEAQATPPTGQTPASTDKPPEDEPLREPGKRALEAERQARRDAEAQLADLRKQVEEADLKEVEKLRNRLAEAESKSQELERSAQDTRNRAVVERAASKLGFVDPADAWGLIDHAQIDFDSEGNPSNAAELLGALAKSKPYLVGNGKPGRLPGGGAKPSEGFSMDDWLRDQAKGRGRVPT